MNFLWYLKYTFIETYLGLSWSVGVRHRMPMGSPWSIAVPAGRSIVPELVNASRVMNLRSFVGVVNAKHANVVCSIIPVHAGRIVRLFFFLAKPAGKKENQFARWLCSRGVRLSRRTNTIVPSFKFLMNAAHRRIITSPCRSFTAPHHYNSSHFSLIY